MKEGWTYKKLGEVANVTDYVANGSFATLRENVHYLDTGGYAILVRLADYTNNFDSSRFVYIDEHAYNFLSKSKLYGGEIIMSNVGSIGKSFICPKLSMPMSLAPNTIVINTSNNRFYFYYFKSPSFQSSLKTISSKTALPKFNKTQFKCLTAPVPPIAEQERIVAELDLLSSIIEKKKEQLKTYDQLAQSIFYTMFGDPIDNPKGWEVKKLGEICEIVRGSSPRPIDKYLGGNIPWIKIGDATKGDDIYLNSTKEHIIQEGLSKTRFISKGSLIFANCGVSLGFARILNFDGCIHDGWLAFMNINENVLNKIFMLKSLNVCTTYFRHLAPDGTQPNLNTSIMKSFKQIIPPSSMQETFAEKVEAIERQRALVQQSIEEMQTMFDYTMDKYFG